MNGVEHASTHRSATLAALLVLCQAQLLALNHTFAIIRNLTDLGSDILKKELALLRSLSFYFDDPAIGGPASSLIALVRRSIACLLSCMGD